jgi:hypothetical protein
MPIQPRLARNRFRCGTQSDPSISSVASAIMIPSSNSSVRRSGTLNHYVGDLLHTMRMIRSLEGQAKAPASDGKVCPPCRPSFVHSHSGSVHVVCAPKVGRDDLADSFRRSLDDPHRSCRHQAGFLPGALAQRRSTRSVRASIRPILAIEFQFHCCSLLG